MKHDYAAGGVVFRQTTDGELEVLLIKDRYGNWTLPKGHLDPGETNQQAALREITEETGVIGEIIAPLASIDYQVVKHGELRHKTVTFFLVRACSNELVLPPDDEVQEVVWCAVDASVGRIFHEQVRDVLRQGLEQLRLRSGSPQDEA